MPRISEKPRLLKLLELAASNYLVLIEFFREDNEEGKNEEDEMMHVLALGEECRYIQEDHTCHLEIVRCYFGSNKGRRSLQPNSIVETQLAIVLYRLGSKGEGGTLSKVAGLFGISNGGIIQNLTERIFNALLKHKDQYLLWPNTEERNNLVSETWSELDT
ncbi:uncharacterized protein LOC120772333 [Bactrocera tryoni]|uniref:uncharacterized protein LOC120772333 n=1 Tax=Bactrocera tryoni TaxID=59916 RepID=UPI001A970CFB|nr:uncharacterized protein LOC120772333 [Bactrocera tryoni]